MSTTSASTINLDDEQQVKEVLAGAVLGLWDVVNSLTRLRPSKRERYRVTIFGSARVKPGTFGYDETKRCAAALAELGCDIITGGGPGLMQATNEGAASAPERAKSIGIRVDLPFEQEVNSFVSQAFVEDIAIPQCVASADEAVAVIRKHHTMRMRNHSGKLSRTKVAGQRKQNET